jgi:hypothetical protein
LAPYVRSCCRAGSMLGALVFDLEAMGAAAKVWLCNNSKTEKQRENDFNLSSAEIKRNEIRKNAASHVDRDNFPRLR